MNIDDELRRLFADDRLDVPVRPDAEQVIVAGARRIRRRRRVVATAGAVAVAAVLGSGIALAGTGDRESLPPRVVDDHAAAHHGADGHHDHAAAVHDEAVRATGEEDRVDEAVDVGDLVLAAALVPARRDRHVELRAAGVLDERGGGAGQRHAGRGRRPGRALHPVRRHLRWKRCRVEQARRREHQGDQACPPRRASTSAARSRTSRPPTPTSSRSATACTS